MNIREVRRHGGVFSIRTHPEHPRLNLRRQLLNSAHATFWLIRVAARCGREERTGRSAPRTPSSLGTIPVEAGASYH